MAKARALDKRRKSIKNIRKITRTMELVSTAQFRRAMERAVAANSYTQRIVQLVSDLAKTDQDISHPLLQQREEVNASVLLLLTANRGMCGSYNSGVLRLAQPRYKELRNTCSDVRLHVSGKKGISFMTYHRAPIARTFNQFDHKPTFEEVSRLADQYLEDYRAGKIDRLEVAYTKFVSLSKQYPIIETFLPLGEVTVTSKEDSKENSREGANAVDYEFLPSCQSLLEELVPTAFKVKLFKCFLDAAVSEQIARMIAMKAATENADSIIDHLTTTYNRARQSQITNEIIEVISGATALQ